LDIPAKISDTLLELDVHTLYSPSTVSKRAELNFTGQEDGTCVWCILRDYSKKLEPLGSGAIWVGGLAEPAWYGHEWQWVLGIHTKVDKECRRIASKWFHIIQTLDDEEEPTNQDIIDRCIKRNLFKIPIRKHSFEEIKLQNVEYELVDIDGDLIKHGIVHFFIRAANMKEENQVVAQLKKAETFLGLKPLRNKENRGFLLASFKKNEDVIEEYVRAANELAKELKRDLFFLENQVDFSFLNKPINKIQWKKYGPYSGAFSSHKGHVWKRVFEMFL
jgi:hypothetical protein